MDKWIILITTHIIFVAIILAIFHNTGITFLSYLAAYMIGVVAGTIGTRILNE